MYREGVRARLVYDYPKYVQTEYWTQATGVLARFSALKRAGDPLVEDFSDGVIPCIMGSHSRGVKTQKNPSNRTVLFPHDHLTFVDFAHMEHSGGENPEWGLDFERAVFKRGFAGSINLDKFVQRLNGSNKLRKLGLQFSVRETAPTGYQVDISLRRSEGLEVTEILRAHQNAYYQIAREIIENLPPNAKRRQDKGVIQPAFVFYYVPSVLQAGRARAVFVPTIVPWGGPEKAGILLSRGPDYPAMVSDNIIPILHRKLVG
jgi:hypothetical protein